MARDEFVIVERVDESRIDAREIRALSAATQARS